jgi:hypothetical protein
MNILPELFIHFSCADNECFLPLEAKQDLLLGLHEATAIEFPDDWEGATPVQMMKQLASSWRINMKQLIN